jgi:hypothetical protein
MPKHTKATRPIHVVALASLVAIASSACGGATTKSVAADGTKSGAGLSAGDKSQMLKSIESGGIAKPTAACIADDLEAKVSAADYRLLAKAKRGDTVPDSLQSVVSTVAIDCAAKIGGLGSAAGAVTAADSVAPTSAPAKAAPSATAPATTAPATTTPATTTTTEPVQTVGTKASPVVFGTTAKLVKDYEVAVTKYTPNADELVKAANEYNDPAPAGNQYVLVSMTVTSKGTEDKRVPAYDLFPKAVSASGKSYEASSCLATLPNPIDYFNDVFTGTSVSGDVCFIVANADAAGLTMYFDVIDPSFKKVTYYFKLS